ncbi:site-specific integrase [Belnapia sp. T18]|uniref:Site-specific integrase n=1 Tax=Belnapia arida TaxID=2804533 RepID=A0ABS1U9N8_9PROT|nr:site-specific integrase [Belnapia arida]MBL6079991.1 site-specific integrase [Belnapia arida]
MLLDRREGCGCPAFWPNVYATVEYGKASRSPNTVVKVLRTLGMARMWAGVLGRDLDHDLRQGNFLSIEDVESLADFLCLTAVGQVEWAARAARTHTSRPERQRVVRLEDARPDPRRLERSVPPVTNPAEIATRVRWVASYVEWQLGMRLGSLDRQQRASENLKKLGEAVVARLRQRAPRSSHGSDDEPTLEGVDRDVLQRIDQAMLPGAKQNPFTPGFVQVRNYLIWRLLLDTGARRAEVREAKADHVKYSTRRFEIHTSKTIPRTVPINPKTADAFDRFMEDFWSKLSQNARRRGFLFTDGRGAHLSLRAINRIFERLREKDSNIPDFLAPHTVRRSWNDQFSATVDSLPPEKRPSVTEEVRIRNRLQGWRGESSMGARYAKRHIRRKSDEIAETLANDLALDSGKND